MVLDGKLKRSFFLNVIFNLALVALELITISTLIVFLGMLSKSTSLVTSFPADIIFGLLDILSSNEQEQLVYLSYLFGVLVLLKCGAAAIQNHQLVALSTEAYDQMVGKLLFTYSRLPHSQFLESSPSEMQKTIISDAYNYSHVIAAVISLVSESLLFIVLISYIAFITPIYSLIALLGLLILVYYLNRSIGSKISSIGERRERLMTSVYRGTAETFRNHKYLYANSMFSFNVANLLSNIKSWSREGKSYGTLSIVPRISMEAIAYLSIVVLFLVGTYFGDGDQSSFFPLLSAFAVVMARLLPSTTRIISQLNMIRFHSKAVQLVREVIERSARSLGRTVRNCHRSIFLSLTITDLEVLSHRDDFLFRVDHLTIRRGDKTVILGGSGSGKSTFLDVLMGLRSFRQGSMLVECKSDDNRIESYHSLFGIAHYIPQRIHLFNGTLFENIALSTEPDVRRCKEIVHLLGLGSLLSSPLQKDVYISEDAMNLSGGQAQRIGIARAIYSDAEILIFDEPTAALDPSSAQLLINIINSVLAERTVIVVTHDNLFREHFHSVLSVTRGALLAI